MGLFSSNQPSLRARILAKFPAQVLAGAGMRIDKSGGTYVFSTAAVPLGTLAPMTPLRLLGRDATPGPPQEISVTGGLQFTGAGGVSLSDSQRARSFAVQFTNPVAPGNFRDFVVPLNCSITRITLLANVAGNVQLDVQKVAFPAFPPTAANSICGGVKPVMTGVNKLQGTTAVGGTFAAWSSGIVAGEIIRVNVDSVSTITQLSVSIDAFTA